MKKYNIYSKENGLLLGCFWGSCENDALYMYMDTMGAVEEYLWDEYSESIRSAEETVDEYLFELV